MNIQLNVKQYGSAADIFAEAAARRLRFEHAGKHPKRKELEPAMAVPAPQFVAKIAPLWEFGGLNFDAHVVEWQLRQVNPALTYLKDRCAELDISFRHVVGAGRRNRVVEIRHLLMWEIYHKFNLSLPQIGRMFGGRDHTTVLYAVNKIEARMAEASSRRFADMTSPN
ncbi:hypothetical protein FHT86_002171 [Rhizobium sp. BK313]|uniref:helix-turn-helix domain-containing protein n=1 Tax=Rhizobium sp. BK313 TaxID=2587081 RepID=UPI001608476F|nr:helix-turn-helix domain-containing protein [Rhizobium sp. BK313]MBB3453915.1 hypothetical protein [Rhizobium sp. BK313]